MSDTQNPNNNKGGKKPPFKFKFNLYWMYSIIAIMLLGLWLMNDSTMTKEIGFSEFEKLAKSGAVEKVTIYSNKDMGEAQLTDSAAKTIFESKGDKMIGHPTVTFSIPSADKFADKEDKWRAEDGFTADVKYEKSNSFSEILWTFGPFILIIGFWLFIMRRMSNQAGGGGVFSVGN